MKPPLLAALLSDIPALAQRLITLAYLFPRADIAAMLGRAPLLMLDDPNDVRASADRLVLLLQQPDVDRCALGSCSGNAQSRLSMFYYRC